MQQLLQIMQKLRAECPWDRAQTPQSLTRYAIEEAYEVEDAIREGDVQHIKEELGDLLLQVVFQSQMYAEQEAFNFHDVVEVLKEKLIRRHPHVFDENFSALTEQEVNSIWQNIKQQEKAAKGEKFNSKLDKIKLGASVTQAQKLQDYAASLNFDWDHVDGAWQKLQEELQELQLAIQNNDQENMHEELGDCLFSLINVGRKLNQDSDSALLATISKFRTRFAYIEQKLAEQGLTPEQCELVQLDRLWDQAKNDEKHRQNL
ncbi:nucleoside triphosphate pyrophosphohydrolase [Acinetobacter puyangensis]|uniref:MazG family protein n=1 Tax=Acinetobacter puyangensis TaxID=1096779 RepID=A0A240EDX1_9GAMM|nr:nucleoside triphosphate pyrophosphohydrolase [Acinetobacter puyangensis]SNX46463.1 MazG family protein [Acinetobacter puyangensis]